MNESAEQWKKRTKKLTEDEAIEFAKEDLYPYWIGMGPLIGGFRKEDEGEIALFPLSPEFSTKPWSFSFIDPMTVRGERYAEMVKDWHKKYGEHGLSTIIILVSDTDFIKDTVWLEKYRQRFDIPIPVVYDVDRVISEGFDIQDLPTTLFFDQGEESFRHGGVDEVEKIERFFHEYLRRNDPGLPLKPIEEEHLNLKTNSLSWNFSKKNGFIVRHQKPENRPEELEPGEIFFLGEWEQEGDCVFTKDNKASILIQSTRANLSVIAKPMKISADKGRMVVSIEEKPVYSKNAGQQLFVDDSGRSYAQVSNGELYHLVQDLPNDERLVSLSFPNASRLQIGVFGVRLYD